MYYDLDKNWLTIMGLKEESIDEFFRKYIPSKKMCHLLIQNKWILVDDKPAKRESYINNKKIKIRLYDDKIVDDSKQSIDIRILYEDPFLLVVSKPAGMLVHTDETDSITLYDCVNHHFHKNGKYGTPNAIHRLDRDTTGLVMFSKSPIFQSLFDMYVMQKKIDRQYIAFVKGNVNKDKKFLFKNPIGRSRNDSKKRIVTKNGDSAITKVCSIGTDGNISALNCELETGRTHQIRVHLSYHGFPILNDNLYGVSFPQLLHMGLIGYKLSFWHPFREESINIKLNLDEEFKRLLEQCTK